MYKSKYTTAQKHKSEFVEDRLKKMVRNVDRNVEDVYYLVDRSEGLREVVVLKFDSGVESVVNVTRRNMARLTIDVMAKLIDISEERYVTQQVKSECVDTDLKWAIQSMDKRITDIRYRASPDLIPDDPKETVTLTYKDGSKVVVPVSLDSLPQMVIDVMAVLA